MIEKVMGALQGRNWVLLGQYKTEYPMNWIKTIKRCLENDENLYDFRYNSTGELQQIIITCPKQHYGGDWHFYIVFQDDDKED